MRAAGGCGIVVALMLGALARPHALRANERIPARAVAADAAIQAYVELGTVLPRLAEQPREHEAWRRLAGALAVVRRVEPQFRAELDECYQLSVLRHCLAAFNPGASPLLCLGHSERRPGHIERLARRHSLSAAQLSQAAAYEGLSCSAAAPSLPGDGPFERQFGHRPPLPLSQALADDAPALELRLAERAPEAFFQRPLRIVVEQSAPARPLAWMAQLRVGDEPWERIRVSRDDRLGIDFASTETFGVKVPKRIGRDQRVRIIATDGRQVATLEYGPFQQGARGIDAQLMGTFDREHLGLPLFDEDARTVLGDDDSLRMWLSTGAQPDSDLTCEWFGPEGELVERRECRRESVNYPRLLLGSARVKLHVRVTDERGSHVTLYFYVDANDDRYDAAVRAQSARATKRTMPRSGP